MFQKFTNLFIFTKSERSGVLGLVLIILIILGIRLLLMNFSEKEVYDYSEISLQLAELKKHQDTIQDAFADSKYKKWDKSAGKFNKKYSKDKFSNKSRYTIDPNTANIDDWRQLGFSKKQAQSILNYRSKGAVFRKKSDLLKLFMVDDEKLADISDNISIAQITPKEYPKKEFPKEIIDKKKINYKPKLRAGSININTADTSDLKQIRGIGSYYAKSIVKYRSFNGGYISKDQFLKVYGLQDNPASIDSLTKYVWFDESAIVKLNLNTCTYEELARLPFSSWKIAKAVIAYRDMHGKFEDVMDINKSDLVSDELSSKIAPYLKLHDDK